MPGIDLHTHSTASDGTLPPAELVALAKRTGLTAMALTDHDTMRGVPAAIRAGEKLDIDIIAGCELSVDSEHGFMHILGLFLPEQPEGLLEAMQKLQQLRARRNERIVEKLQSLGIEISIDRIREIAGEGSVGRPHIARALVESGHASDMQNAFDSYIGEKGRAYVPKDKFSAKQAIDLIRAEGGTAILAHPYTLQLDNSAEAGVIAGLREIGLGGIEAYYTDHTRTMTEKYLQLAKDLDLAVTGGSDFHGDNKPDIGLGKGKGGLYVPEGCLRDLKERRMEQGLPV